jgi:hypothetical protein
MNKIKAFTLAEILITLGVIGVVTAMTIPTLITKIQNRQNIVKWRKEYSIVNQAFRKAMSDDVTIAKDGVFYQVGYTNEFMNSMLENLKVIDSCGSANSTKNSLGLERCIYPFYTWTWLWTKGVT